MDKYCCVCHFTTEGVNEYATCLGDNRECWGIAFLIGNGVQLAGSENVLPT